MDKKDIYEHLANIYLDASKNKTAKSRKRLTFKYVFFILAAFLAGISAFIILLVPKYGALNSRAAFSLTYEVIKINFNFDPVKKEEYLIDLKNLDMAQFQYLEFALRKANYQDTISLRLEFVNEFSEKAAFYAKDIPHRWQNYKIPLTDFKDISNWSKMKSFSFIVEEWNTKENNGIIYIDNIKLLK